MAVLGQTNDNVLQASLANVLSTASLASLVNLPTYSIFSPSWATPATHKAVMALLDICFKVPRRPLLFDEYGAQSKLTIPVAPLAKKKAYTTSAAQKEHFSVVNGSTVTPPPPPPLQVYVGRISAVHLDIVVLY
ncbi:uncharacterized protein LOC123517630 [Portunus trituberculatus]|uniref:uncharacterized protein LOC123517630 n=1 Tax=Portunus trituberculatus TaxID=210409 RepID=UPI001E1D114D|nr:uncharacterized protein LOC123517630 [Portunus trituberculatus]